MNSRRKNQPKQYGRISYFQKYFSRFLKTLPRQWVERKVSQAAGPGSNLCQAISFMISITIGRKSDCTLGTVGRKQGSEALRTGGYPNIQLHVITFLKRREIVIHHPTDS